MENPNSGNMIVFGMDGEYAWSLSQLNPPWTINLSMDRRKLQYGGKEALKKCIEELSEVSEWLDDMVVNSSLMLCVGVIQHGPRG
jgi:hypothetical protein